MISRMLFPLLLIILLPGSVRATNDTCRLEEALMYVRLADQYFNDHEKCLYFADRALPELMKFEAYEAIVDLRIGLNSVYRTARDTVAWKNNATMAYEIALDRLAPNDQLRIYAANNYASMLLRIYNDAVAARTIREEAYRSLPADALPQIRGGLLYNIGNGYFRIGDFRTAERYYVVADSAYREDEERLRIPLIEVATERCRILTAGGKFRAAITTATTALNRLRPGERLANPRALRCQLHLAENFRAAGDNDEAQALLTRLASVRGQSANQYALIAYQQAAVWFDRGELSRSRKLLDGLSYPDLHPVQQARAYKLAARSAYRSGHQETAQVHLQSAFRVLCPQGRHAACTTNCFDHSLSLSELAGLLRTKARWTAAADREGALMEALEIYHNLTQLIDFARARYQSKDAQLLLLGQSKTLYQEAMDVLWQLHESATGSAPDSLTETIHYFLEKSKSNLLRDERDERTAYRSNRLKKALVDRQYRLRAQLATLRREESANAEALLDCERALEQLADSLRGDVSLRLPPPPPRTLRQLRNELIGADGVLINYFTGEYWIYRLRAGPDATDFVRFPATAITAAKVDTFMHSLGLETDQRMEIFSRLGLQWQRLLIDAESLSPGTKRLLLVPDGLLAQLPFATLLTEKQSNDKRPYLIRRFRISLLHTTTVPEQKTAPSAQGMLGVFPLFQGQDRQQQYVEDRLPELTAYAGSHLVGAKAGRVAFREQAPDHTLLVLTTHARMSDSLYGEPSLSFHDGDLLLSDLAGDRLNARLAILTACESGRGREVRGEGTMSLARGFGYAGVDGVVMSLWPIAEQTAVSQTVDLLSLLEEGLPAAEALRLTQLNYLDGLLPEQAKAPVYWAGLTLVGNVGRVKLVRKARISSWTAGLVALSIAITFILAKLVPAKVLARPDL